MVSSSSTSIDQIVSSPWSAALCWQPRVAASSTYSIGDSGITPPTCSITSAITGASPLRSAKLFARPHRAWGLRPPPAPSSDRVINAEHINQLSRFHAQSFKILNFVRSDQALYFFGKKLFVKNFFVQTLFVTHKFQYPVYLGASFVKPFLLQMIILVWLRSLFVYYATICTMLT